MVEKSLLHLPR